MTDDQRISNIVELARPLDRESLAELAGWIAIELGAMKTADEYRENIARRDYLPVTKDDCWKPVITKLPDDYSDVRGNVLPDYNS
jgi:hypothetical protein